MANGDSRGIYLQAGPHSGMSGAHGGGTRSVVMGKTGMVSAAHWLASQEAVGVFEEGGNAFDAAVCAAAVVSIAEPHMSGIGGVGGAVVFDAASGTCDALDFHGFAPAAASPERWSRQEDLIDGLGGALVPGVVAGWAALIERYGTMSFARLLRPAVEWAAHGVPVSILCAEQIRTSFDRLRQSEPASRVFLPNGSPLRAGDLLVQQELSDTLATLAQEGADAFYHGTIASAIAEECTRGGGLLTKDDLAAGREAQWSDPAVGTYRGHTVATLPPPYASFQVLETLGILDGFDLASLGYHSAEHIHLLVEAVKLARADRLRFPSQDASASLDWLLSDEHLASLRAAIDSRVARVGSGDWYDSTPNALAQIIGELGPKHTTHLVTADSAGNLVSLTQTLGWLFGGGAIVGETGVLLNDMCYWFDLTPASPNVIGPRKRMGSPIAPVVVMSPDGVAWMASGTPGGHGILQTTAQIVSNTLDFGHNPQTAVEAPRVRADEGHYLAVETRIPGAVIDRLTALGHECHAVGDWMYAPQDGRSDIGRGSMAVRDARSGMLYAGADPRGDGFALGY